LPRSHSATEFVAWYNGHPDFRDYTFDLSQERAVVIGIGNVAVDVARILSKTVDELARTDIADYALEALAESRIREVIMMGRRGPAQAAFTTPEIKEMGELEDANTVAMEDELELDPLSRAALEASPDRTVLKKLEILSSYVGGSNPGADRTCQVRFLLSPVEILPAADGGVGAIRVVRNRLVEGRNGRLSARASDETFEWPVGLVFRSVGYRGVALPGLPFHEAWGVVHNQAGRITDENGVVVPGCYVGGWIKRGPTGVIGTNKPDAVETVECMLDDVRNGICFTPETEDPDAVLTFVESKQPDLIRYADWLRLDELERTEGERQGRPRVKFTTVEDMLAALSRTS
jgi:ferredoxin--NADP+ reductase